jgi:acyl dehydratase
MGDAAAVSYHFSVPPSAARYYVRALLARRAPLVPAGATVPRLEGEVEVATARPRNLRVYRQVCGFAANGRLPITYPHVMAMPLHLAILTHRQFVVRLMGLIHVANEIEQLRPLPEDRRYRMRSWVEGFRDGDRGQEFELFTELADRDGVAWREKCTLLARRVGTGTQAARAARSMLQVEKPPRGVEPDTAPVTADRGTGRRYGFTSGDLNPIHLADRSAKLFGFDRAVAHGMWSMARSLAHLMPLFGDTAVRASAEFKLPLFLPGQAQLTHWPQDARRVFVLRSAEGARPHLAGSIEPLQP